MENKIKTWLKDPKNLVVLGVILFGIAIRFYYFLLTKNQPLWWDEAEYLSIAKKWVFGIPFDIFIVRPILLPFIAAVLFKTGFGELAVRVFIFLCSAATIFIVYLFTKEMYTKTTAIIATLLMSFFYLHIFHTGRILTEAPTTLFWVLAAYLFWKGFIQKKSPCYAYGAAFVTALGILMRFPFGMIVIPFVIALFLSEKIKPLKEKKTWIALLIFIVPFIPYSIWSIKEFGKISLFAAKGFYENNVLFMDYIKLLPNYFFSPIPFIQKVFPSLMHILLLLFIIGVIIQVGKIVISYDLLLKERSVQQEVFIFLLMITPFIYFSFFHDHVEDRFLIYLFPAAFMIIAKTLTMAMEWISKYDKMLAVSAVSVILALGLINQVALGDSIIRGKSESYKDLKDAGLWIKENSDKSNIVISAGTPENTYYSERETIGFPSTIEEFEQKVRDIKPRYVIISAWEKSPDWSYSYYDTHKEQLNPVFGSFQDAEKTKPTLIVFEVQQAKF